MTFFGNNFDEDDRRYWENSEISVSLLLKHQKLQEILRKFKPDKPKKSPIKLHNKTANILTQEKSHFKLFFSLTATGCVLLFVRTITCLSIQLLGNYVSIKKNETRVSLLVCFSDIGMKKYRNENVLHASKYDIN